MYVHTKPKKYKYALFTVQCSLLNKMARATKCRLDYTNVNIACDWPLRQTPLPTSRCTVFDRFEIVLTPVKRVAKNAEFFSRLGKKNG